MRADRQTDRQTDILIFMVVYNSLWFSLAALLRQGCDISPRSVSSKRTCTASK